jgi:hypothetical protein
MPQSTVLCQRVVKIAEDYLGPSAPRFIDRLSCNHLGKESSQLAQGDLEELIKWARLAAAMLTDDSKLVTEFIGRLERLSH